MLRIIKSFVNWSLRSSATYLLLTEVPEPILFCASILVLAVSLIPPWLERKHNVRLPAPIELLLNVWIAACAIGEAGLYFEYPWLDAVMHVIGPGILAYFLYLALSTLHVCGRISLSPGFINLFASTCAMSLSAVWEILEFYLWSLTGKDCFGTKGDHTASLFDTFEDLQLDVLGITAVIVALHLQTRGFSEQERRAWLYPLAKVVDARVVATWGVEKTADKIE